MRSNSPVRPRRFSAAARLLLLAGILLQLAACLALLPGENLLEYAVCAPDVTRTKNPDGSGEVQIETGLEERIQARSEVQSQLSDGLAALSCSGVKCGFPVSGNGNDAVATLQAVDQCFAETCPRPLLEGRWMDAGELKSGARVAVLDGDLAFKLFGSDSPLERSVRIGDVDYRIIGTARHRRSVGSPDEYGVYIPLAAVAAQGLQLDTLTMYALPLSASGMDQSFRSAMESAWGPGSFYSLRRQIMGGLLLTRLLLFALGMGILLRLFGRLRALGRRFREQIAAMHARSYARDYLLPSAARILLLICAAALLLGAAYALLCFLIEPVYTFTEWVPESLVELSALRKLFWERVSAAARPVRIVTQDVARISYWSKLARLGAVLTLLGCASGRNSPGTRRNT